AARAGDRLHRGRRAGRGDTEVDPVAQAFPPSRGSQARQETGGRGRRRIGRPLSNRDTFEDRLENQAKARQALLERARAKDPTNDPDFAARQEARAEAARLREQREEERRNAKLAERAKAEADREAKKAEQIRLEAEKASRSLRRQIEDLAAQKATRDARYAARKAR